LRREILGDNQQDRYVHGLPPTSILFKNVPYGPKGVKVLTDHVMTPNANQVRSVNAEFDPAKASSADLLAGLAAAGILPPIYRSLGSGEDK
jgi:hypothetical protein